MNQRHGLLLIIALLVITNIITACITSSKAQTITIDLRDGEEALVRCICDPDAPTPMLEPTDTLTPEQEPTDTPVPTNTPRPTVTLTPTSEPPPPDTPTPTLTATPEPAPTSTSTSTVTPQSSSVIHGIARSTQGDWQIMSDELGARVVEFLVRPTHSNATILAGLDEAQSLGLGALVHIHDSVTDTDMPWSLDGGEWQITARGREILQLVENHPALWGVYQLEEPWDYTSEGFADADDQRALYAFLKEIADVPLYTDMATMTRAIDAGYVLSDGMCDLCCVAPTRWANGIDSVLARIDAEYAAYQSVMDKAQLIYMVNVYERGSYRYPTEAELRAARGRMCELGVSHLYYPWVGYDGQNLSAATHLWSSIAEGCK